MADFSIDQNNLPRVKEVCRDFAVLEDHCLAHNLQEQEIESHLASNVHKSRLVQQDLRVAKLLQEEEDQRAKAVSKRQLRHIERIDNEMAQEIQEQLVWQAEQQRKQEEKDEAIARKLQEREMKEERKRHKQQDSNFEEEYYEDQGVCEPHLVKEQASRPQQDPRHQHPGSVSPGYRKERYQDHSSSRSPYNSPDPHRKRNPNNSHGTRSRYPDSSESGHLRPPERFPEHHSPERRPKHSEDYSKERHRPLDVDYMEPRRRIKPDPMDESRTSRDDQETVVRRKEKPPKDHSATRDKDRKRDREREQNAAKTKERQRERDQRGRSRDRTFSGDRGVERRGRPLDREMDRNSYAHESKERGRDGKRERHKSRDKHHSRDGSREKEIDGDSLDPSGRFSEDGLEREEHKSRPRLPSGPNDVFEEPNLRGLSNDGRRVRGEYGMREATHGLAHLDLQDQELKDLEVARMLQEEEIKASQIDKRDAQVSLDEVRRFQRGGVEKELARRLMEEEKREYKKSRDKEKRRAEVEYKPVQEEVVRPRTRDEVYNSEEEYQRARNHKPARPPPPIQDYENINPSYAYVESPYSPRPPSRPEAAYKGAYYRQ
ncbi:coiled-coil domain-containing protein 50 isoform X2 [Triplophysa dalaica]|uniref:coiled-coil domain-containing protein 50 isoform X2 n=1 Tax=Triplophysa dalaica TaxID=1582913 RepID=UPI0024DF72F3|nr:coiled-coil domain-containing protein 50 isoform X2 [Triplophysa dalaica]